MDGSWKQSSECLDVHGLSLFFTSKVFCLDSAEPKSKFTSPENFFSQRQHTRKMFFHKKNPISRPEHKIKSSEFLFNIFFLIVQFVQKNNKNESLSSYWRKNENITFALISYQFFRICSNKRLKGNLITNSTATFLLVWKTNSDKYRHNKCFCELVTMIISY